MLALISCIIANIACILQWILDNIFKSNLVANWLVAIGTILLSIVAIFQDKLRAWVMRPKLRVTIQVAPPDCHKSVIECYNEKIGIVDVIVEVYYFRLLVKNDGNQRAELVEVFAKKLTEKKEDGAFTKVSTFMPMNLTWTHTDDKIFYEAISPHMYRNCSLGHIIDPSKRRLSRSEQLPEEKSGKPFNKAVFSFDLEIRPNTGGHLIKPGTYRLDIVVAAANVKPISKTLEIAFNGEWCPNEAEMFRRGISIKML